LTNKEVGWKTEWMNHHLQINGAVFEEKWTGVQVAEFCPACGIGNLTFSTNGPDYRVRGLELEWVAKITQGLTIHGSATWNSSSQTNSPRMVGNIPGRASSGKPIPTYCDQATTPCTVRNVGNLYGPNGSSLAESPPFQANLRVRYEWQSGDFKPYWQLAAAHSAHSYGETGLTALANAQAGVDISMPAWTTYDGAIGVYKDAWYVELFGQNLTDENKSLFTSTRQQIMTQTPMRPRVL